MSTILKTLKKLEEEKSVLEKKLDLKELVLQDEESFFIESRISRKSLWRGAMLLVGIVLAMVWVLKDSRSEKQVVHVSQPNPVNLQQPVPVKKQSISSVPGIPLSNIPEQRRPEIYPPADSETEFYPAAEEYPENTQRVVEPVKRPTPPARAYGQQDKGVFEIQSLIASAKSLADAPEEIEIPKIFSNLSIPGLRVKGIIFFSEGSSSNHIFVSNEQSKNQKMRIGDTINSATLMKIESTGAVFAYQGESVFIGIGQSGG